MNWTHKSKVLIQGITTPWGLHYAAQMKAYGTNVVAGVSIGGGGEKVNRIPVFDLVEQAIAKVGPVEIGIIFVEPYAVLDAALEAIAAGIPQLILATHKVPPLDLVRLLRKAQETHTLILGPGSAGAIVPEQLLLGTLEPQFYTPGNIGLISRSDNLMDEIAFELTQAQWGQSIAVNLGNSAIIGSSFETWLEILEQDPATEAILVIEQNFTGNQEAAIEYLNAAIDKPVIAYLAGGNVPPPTRSREVASMIAARVTEAIPHTSTAVEKMTALKKAKVTLAKRPSQIPDLLAKVLQKKAHRLER